MESDNISNENVSDELKDNIMEFQKADEQTINYKFIKKRHSNGSIYHSQKYLTEILIIVTMSIRRQNYKDSTRIRRQNRFNVKSSSSPYSFDVESTSKSLSFQRGFDVESITSNPRRILVVLMSNRHRNPYHFDEDSTSNR